MYTKRARIKVSLIMSVIGVFTLINGIPFASAAEESPKIDIEKIKKEITESPFFGAKTADMFIKKYGSEAIPLLIDLLKGDLPPHFKGKVSYYLGRYKEARTIQPMIDLIEQTIKSPITSEGLDLLKFTMCGIGFTDRPEGYTYLIKLVNEEYWKNVTFVPYSAPEASDERNLKVYLRQWAVNGISCGDSQTSLTHLKDLQKNGPETLKKHIDSVISAHENPLPYKVSPSN